ncbi:alpha/beta hydrolase [bacterium]|nr:alpha/beta hydrolase [bacterium]
MKLQRVVTVLALFVLFLFGTLHGIRFYSSKAVFPVRGEYINLDGKKLYTIARGKGKTVLFLHGFPYHSESFSAIASRPFEGYRFITMDFPGAGLSGKKLSEAPTPESLAVLIKLFLDRIGVQKVDLVGHDFGGGVAIVTAALFPQMVEKVVLIAPDSSVGTSARVMSKIWHFPILGELWSTVRLDRQFIRDLLKRSWHAGDAGWHQIVERYARILGTQNGRQGFLALHRSRMDFDYLPYEERYATETLILWGSHDRVLPATAGQRLLRSLGRSEMKVLEGQGHLPQEENPDAVYEMIKLFFTQKSKKIDDAY